MLTLRGSTGGPVAGPQHRQVSRGGIARMVAHRVARSAFRRFDCCCAEGSHGPSGQPKSTGDPDRPAGARSAKSTADPPTSSGHHPRIGQPHDDALEGPIATAEEAAARISTPTQPLGPPGRPFDWRSPFFIGVAATAGVAVTVGAIWLLSVAAQALLLIALGLFLAVGLEPAVSWFVARGLAAGPRSPRSS